MAEKKTQPNSAPPVSSSTPQPKYASKPEAKAALERAVSVNPELMKRLAKR
jgi:hypothetical protein